MLLRSGEALVEVLLVGARIQFVTRSENFVFARIKVARVALPAVDHVLDVQLLKNRPVTVAALS